MERNIGIVLKVSFHIMLLVCDTVDYYWDGILSAVKEIPIKVRYIRKGGL